MLLFFGHDGWVLFCQSTESTCGRTRHGEPLEQWNCLCTTHIVTVRKPCLASAGLLPFETVIIATTIIIYTLSTGGTQYKSIPAFCSSLSFQDINCIWETLSAPLHPLLLGRIKKGITSSSASSVSGMRKRQNQNYIIWNKDVWWYTYSIPFRSRLAHQYQVNPSSSPPLCVFHNQCNAAFHIPFGSCHDLSFLPFCPVRRFGYQSTTANGYQCL